MKKLFLSTICLIFAVTLNAQVKSFPKDWHLLDYKKDSVFGISLKEAYTLLSDRQPKQKTIVAVIDSGGDINHEDLKDVLWSSEDGKHGWNYLGDSDGTTFIIGTSEADREYLKYYKSYLDADTTKLSKKEMADYHYFQKVVLPKSKIGAICRSISTFDETILLKDRFRDFMIENFKDQTFTNNMCRKAQDMVGKNKSIPYNERLAY